MNKLKSRKFILAVASLLFVVLTDLLGVKVDEQTFNTIVMLVASYIVGQGAVDVAGVIKNKE